MTASSNMWDPATVTAFSAAIVAVIGAIAGLFTAIHGHSVATQANATATAANAHAKATSDGVDRLATILAPGVRVNSQPPTTYASGALSPSVVYESVPDAGSLNSSQLGTLVAWLREQHKAQTGAYPDQNTVTTDWSQAIMRINQIRSAQ